MVFDHCYQLLTSLFTWFCRAEKILHQTITLCSLLTLIFNYISYKDIAPVFQNTLIMFGLGLLPQILLVLPWQALTIPSENLQI